MILENYTEGKNRKIKEETTMKAMYIDAPGQVSIKDVEMPVRKEGEVLLKILYGGICGSDLGSYVEPSLIVIIRESRATSSPLRLSRQMRTMLTASSRE